MSPWAEKRKCFPFLLTNSILIKLICSKSQQLLELWIAVSILSSVNTNVCQAIEVLRIHMDTNLWGKYLDIEFLMQQTIHEYFD
jgi:hypothetical protein